MDTEALTEEIPGKGEGRTCPWSGSQGRQRPRGAETVGEQTHPPPLPPALCSWA